MTVFTFSEREGWSVLGESESFSVMLGEVDNDTDVDYINLAVTRR